jgi:perosamine synthetase
MTSPVRDIPFARPSITEADREAVFEVLEGHVLTHGPRCRSFEKDFADFLGEGAHTVSVSSCMAALHLAYLHFGIGVGDEVVVPAQTHAATAHAVEWTGAKPVFVDCDPATGNITATAIEAAITDRTKAISVVHFVGIPCDMPPIMELAARFNLRVVEDCAVALGTRFDEVHVGLFGDAGCFSFYPVKHITTGEGGMFVSRHEKAVDAVGRLRAFGVDRTHSERAEPGIYDVPVLGLNYRMSELQAALGGSQLSRLPANLDQRRSHFSSLKSSLESIGGLRVLDNTSSAVTNSHYCLSLVLDESLGGKRRELVASLKSAGIGTSVYYPQPVPRMTYYLNKYGYEPEHFVEAARISDHSIALPVGPHLKPGDVEHIAETVRHSIERIRK